MSTIALDATYTVDPQPSGVATYSRKLIEALATLDDAAARLLVVGKGETGPYRALAGRLGVGGRVVWLGPRPEPERWYAAADAVVLPSRYEPFGNVHLEALASGVPVVASRAAGGAEVIEEGKNGAVADPRDARAVARALMALPAPRPNPSRSPPR